MLILTICTDTFLDFASRKFYGFALSYWRRQYAPKWHVGVRFTVLLGQRRPSLRLATYSCPSVSVGYGLPKTSTCVLTPIFEA